MDKKKMDSAKETSCVTNAMRQNEVFEKTFLQTVSNFDRYRNLEIVNDEFRIWDITMDIKGTFSRSKCCSVFEQLNGEGKSCKSESNRGLRTGVRRVRAPLSYKQLQRLSELSYKCPQIDNIEIYAQSRTLNHVMKLAEQSQKNMNQEHLEIQNSKKASKIFQLRNQTLPFPLMKPSLTPEDVKRQMMEKPSPLVKFPQIVTGKRDSHEAKLRRIELKKVGNVERLKHEFIKDVHDLEERKRSQVTDEKVIVEFHDCKRLENKGLDPVQVKMAKLEEGIGFPSDGVKCTRASTFRGVVKHVMNIMRWTRAVSMNKTTVIKWDAVRRKIPFRFDRERASANRNNLVNSRNALGYIEDQPCLESMRHSRLVRFSVKQGALVNATLEREPLGSHYDILAVKKVPVPIWAKNQRPLGFQSSAQKSLHGNSVGVISGHTLTVSEDRKPLLPSIDSK